MTISRRDLLGRSLIGAAGVAALRRTAAAAPSSTPTPTQPVAPAATHAAGSKLVVPNGRVLAPTKVDGTTRVYHLIAEPIAHEIAPGLAIDTWGYNGSTPGPVIEGTEGDRIRVYVTNKLPEVTSVHWHGIFVPHGMDGVAGLTQKPIAPGKTFKYEFVLDRPGTFMYHPHADEMTQIALGMMGMIVVHPRRATTPVARDYALFAHEMKIAIGARRVDPMAMSDFNVLTFNGKSFPATAPLVGQVGERIRIRFANLGPMDHHPLHLHGHAFEVVATDGGAIAPSARIPETTVVVPVGTTRTIEFVARAPGDWPLHCHMTHHVMNQMGHDAPNLIGANTTGLDAKLGRVVPGYMTMGHNGMGDMADMRMTQPKNSISMLGGKGPHGTIDMGGMFTILKIRDRLPAGDGDPGWYDAPAATIASEASADDLARDGIPSR